MTFILILFLGKLVLSEEVSIGDISFATYRSYIRAAGGWFVAFVVILLYFVAAGSLVFSDWWLSEWINTLSTVISATLIRKHFHAMWFKSQSVVEMILNKTQVTTTEHIPPKATPCLAKHIHMYIDQFINA